MLHSLPVSVPPVGTILGIGDTFNIQSMQTVSGLDFGFVRFHFLQLIFRKCLSCVSGIVKVCVISMKCIIHTALKVSLSSPYQLVGQY